MRALIGPQCESSPRPGAPRPPRQGWYRRRPRAALLADLENQPGRDLPAVLEAQRQPRPTAFRLSRATPAFISSENSGCPGPLTREQFGPRPFADARQGSCEEVGRSAIGARAGKASLYFGTKA